MRGESASGAGDECEGNESAKAVGFSTDFLSLTQEKIGKILQAKKVRERRRKNDEEIGIVLVGASPCFWLFNFAAGSPKGNDEIADTTPATPLG